MEGTPGHGRKRKGRAGSTVILIIAIVVLVIALWRLIPLLLDYRQSQDTYQDLQGEIVGLDPDSTDTSDEPWNAYDWASVTIDFNALWQINPEVVGWIRFDDTDAVPVDYPIMYSGDNDKYLRTDLYGESHTSGSIFLEAANSPDFTDIYNIIYGHNMRNGTMFGSLKQYKRDENFYDANPYFTIYTPLGAFRYAIFGYADVKDDSDIYRIGFVPDQTYKQQIDIMLASSDRNTGIVPTVDQQTVTLSTCTSTGDNYRFVVYGVCVENKLY